MASTIQQSIDEVAKRECHCVPCDFCHGQGTYWANIRTGLPSDDCSHILDDIENCEECHGGIIEMCDRCAEMEELYQLLDEDDNRA